MIPVLKLPLHFDATSMQADVARFSSDEWTPHFNTQYYEGDWSGVALRAPEGAHVALALYPDPTKKTYVATPAMERCPSVKSALSSFECETESVRFLRLGPGGTILRHRDYCLSVEDGVARVHVPVKTTRDVEFYLDDNRVDMKEGEAWYLNFNLYHSVVNNGPHERVHLVIDCVVNDWFRSFFGEEIKSSSFDQVIDS